ncbi:hypothetical protein D9758_007341 [Tetrapyrgos nigripes]|uniref:Uncharacterized protein n=1 Tax=Tetrapyrgos nigripes TaxID=182062 RepID=A0A8H5GB56_9AGAR|nr:hypothetical protein D9758_007341 [Tetrapyrgos nigripes]
MFCKISDTVIMKISAACVIFAMLCIMLIEICIAVTVCRHWKAFHKLAKYERDSRKWENCKSIIRFTFFFMLAALCFGISIALSFGETNDWDPVLNARSNIVTEIMPMAVAVTFGTQKDILRSLIICKRRKHLAEDNIAAGQAISQNKAAIPA